MGVCVCGGGGGEGACVRSCVRVCVYTDIVIVKYIPCI